MFVRACSGRRRWMAGEPGVPDPATSRVHGPYYVLCDSAGRRLAGFWIERGGRLRFLG